MTPENEQQMAERHSRERQALERQQRIDKGEPVLADLVWQLADERKKHAAEVKGLRSELAQAQAASGGE